MKKVDNIVSIPKFVDKYISLNMLNSAIMHDFCKMLMETEVEDIDINNEGHTVFTFDQNTSYTFSRFLKFYFEKSELSPDLQCVYENELDLPKSLSNELFVLEYNNNVFTTYISSYDNAKLQMTAV